MSVTQTSASRDVLSVRGTRGLARGLGWFSIGLGVIELLVPQALSRPLGLRGHERLTRFYGLREIGTGIGILNSADPTPWIWGRVAGDALDVSTVAAGLIGPRKSNVVLALALLGGVGALDLICAEQLSRNRETRVSS